MIVGRGYDPALRKTGDIVMEYITNSPEETEALGAALGKVLTPGTVIAYRGENRLYPGACPGSGLRRNGHQPYLYHCE